MTSFLGQVLFRDLFSLDLYHLIKIPPDGGGELKLVGTSFLRQLN